jgi:hypothetical protein
MIIILTKPAIALVEVLGSLIGGGRGGIGGDKEVLEHVPVVGMSTSQSGPRHLLASEVEG